MRAGWHVTRMFLTDWHFIRAHIYAKKTTIRRGIREMIFNLKKVFRSPSITCKKSLEQSQFRNLSILPSKPSKFIMSSCLKHHLYQTLRVSIRKSWTVANLSKTLAWVLRLLAVLSTNDPTVPSSSRRTCLYPIAMSRDQSLAHEADHAYVCKHCALKRYPKITR